MRNLTPAVNEILPMGSIKRFDKAAAGFHISWREVDDRARERLGLLCLQQFADSALPIGGAAHSFGLESLVDRGFLNPENLEQFLSDYLGEAGTLEASYCFASCKLACQAADERILDQWSTWNAELGARKLARDSRDASSAMGRRFLRLAAQVSNISLLVSAARWITEREAEVHLAACFGLVAGAMELDADFATVAYLQQSMSTLVSCCQRLIPLGQTRAHQILWSLKPAILCAAEQGAQRPAMSVDCFTPLLDIASARHPGLHTRLFMS
jgi:urease accessory protein